MGLISMTEPTSVNEALSGDGWTVAMQEKLNQFHKNDVHDLLNHLIRTSFETKWVYMNKFNEERDVVRNKVTLITQGYNQKESIDYTKTSMTSLISMTEPTSVDEALSIDGWIVAIQEKLNQFHRNDVRDLLNHLIRTLFGTKWVYINKLNEQHDVVRNKATLITQGYNQQGSIDYTKFFARVAKLKANRLLVTFRLCYTYDSTTLVSFFPVLF